MEVIYQQKALEKTEGPSGQRQEGQRWTWGESMELICFKKKPVSRRGKVYTELGKIGARGKDVINNLFSSYHVLSSLYE